ncbi:MAG: hypothetical protein AB1486_13650 [Planctomycetota bacterium]
MRWIKKLLAAGLVTLALVLVSLAILEIVLQCADDLYRRKVNHDWKSLHEVSPVTGWALRPGASGFITTEGETVAIEINSLGLRDREIGPKEAGVARILCLGDSFLYDVNFPQEATYVAVAQAEMLSQRLRVELVNAGVIGWGTDQQYLYYKEKGHLLEPDIVLLHLFVGNDINENNDAGFREILGLPPPPKPTFDLADGALVLRNFPYAGALRPQFADAADRARLTAQLGLLADHGLRSLELLDRGLCQVAWSLGLLRPEPPEKPQFQGRAALLKTVFDEPLTPPFEKGVALTKALIKALADEVRRHGSRFGVVVIPACAQIEAASEDDYHRLAHVNLELLSFIMAEGIPALDLGISYRAVHGHYAHLYGGTHWNAAGHAVAALAVTRWLREAFELE